MRIAAACLIAVPALAAPAPAQETVPVVRSALLRAYGRDLRRRLNAASAVLTTLALRDLNQQVIDARLPEAVGGEFTDDSGLGGSARRRGPRIVVGFQDIAENRNLFVTKTETASRLRVAKISDLARYWPSSG
jgi:hypothetical protein